MKLHTLTRTKNKQKPDPYGNIDWDKVAVLFKKPLPPRISSKDYLTTGEILHILAGIGAVGLLFMFPALGIALKPFVSKERKIADWRIKQAFRRLAKQNYVSMKENNRGQVTVAITRQGMMRSLTYELDTLQILPTKRWDKKWRVVIFDIPEKFKRTRDVFRMRLRQMGMHQLQESVYVSPYPCFNEVEFLRELYGVAFTVRYLLVEKLEEDEFLREHFTLPLQ